MAKDQPDPWAKVARFHVRPHPDYSNFVQHVDVGLGQPTGFYLWAPEVEAARAAERQQHDEEVARLDHVAQSERSAAVRAEMRAERAEAQAVSLQAQRAASGEGVSPQPIELDEAFIRGWGQGYTSLQGDTAEDVELYRRRDLEMFKRTFCLAPVSPVEPPPPREFIDIEPDIRVVRIYRDGSWLEDVKAAGRRRASFPAAEPTPEPPTASVDEKASKWLKATMLSKGRDEDTLPTAVDRAVRRVLGSCSGQSLHRQLVMLVRELAPTGVPAQRVGRLIESALPPSTAESWLCFHCGELFTSVGAAADHFGATPDAQPGCLIDRVACEEGGKPERGRGLLIALRKAENTIAELRAENDRLDNDVRLWHESEAYRIRTIGHRQWTQELDYRDGEKFALQADVARLAESVQQWKQKADFIAHAPDDIAFLLDELNAQPTGAPTPCVWKRDGKSWTWLSGCGYQFEAAFACDPPEDEMHWCSYCGHPLTVER